MYYPIIISPNHSDRTNLWSLLEGSGLYARINSVRTTAEALTLIERDPLIDVVMISSELGESRIVSFLDRAKKITTGKRCSYVLLCKQDELKSSTVINLMMAGIHSFLTEPYSVEALQETTIIADGVNSAHSRVRLRVAGSLLFSQIATELGHLNSTDKKTVSEQMKAQALNFRKATGRSFWNYLDAFASTLLVLSPAKRVEKTRGQLRISIRRSIEELFKHSSR